jgi:hypothetical protein
MPTVKTKKGDRVQLISTSDRMTLLKSGDQGVVMSARIDPWGDFTISVKWDSGSSLSLISSEDYWQVI